MKRIIKKSGKHAIYSVCFALLATMLWSCKYKKINDYSEELASVQAFSGKWGYIDKNKNEVIPCIYDNAQSFLNGYAIVEKGKGSWGIIDKNGKEVLACNYDLIDYFGNSMRKIILKGKYGVFDLAKGQVSIPTKYDEIADGFYQRDSLIMIKMNGKFGFIDLNDKEITPCKYDEIRRDFTIRLKSARINYKNGYEETQSNEFDRRFTLVRVNNKYGIINKSGVEVFPCIYDNIDFFIKDLIELKLDDKVGFFDVKGKEIIPLKYDRLIQFRNDSIVMASGNKITLFNFSGKMIGTGTLTQ